MSKDIRRRRRLIADLAIAVGLAVVVGCGSSDEGSSDSTANTSQSYKLAAINPDASDPFWATVMCSAQAQAKKVGVDLEVTESADRGSSALQTAVNSALLTKPQGLFLNSFEASQFAAQVRTLMSQGVPVVTAVPFDPPTQYKDLSFDGNGENFLDAFFDLLPPDEKGSIVALGGVAGLAQIEEEYKPLLAATKEQRPNIRVLPTQYDNFDVNKVTSITSELLIAHPDLKVIIAPASPEALGAAAAVQHAGKAGQVKIFGFDAVPAEVSLLKKGVIDVLIAKPAKEMGIQAMDSLVEALESNSQGGPVKANVPHPKLPMNVITRDTLNEAQQKGYLYDPECSA